jgi:transcriptional regulator with XRE-family HTH domain
MTESELFAVKLKQCLEETGISKKQLADHFGVKAPSVYDWVNFGRISKSRIPELAKYFNKPIGWWLGSDDEEQLLNEHERQLLQFYRQLSDESREKLLQDANYMHNIEHKTKSVANPFGKNAKKK